MLFIVISYFEEKDLVIGSLFEKIEHLFYSLLSRIRAEGVFRLDNVKTK